ncbi:hypothetical protein [Polyangium sp. 6x1]|uniref:hypothetical protein n=1 Tax=Polyangium sp. 6x1 TaxID=3042689 RepID=UPI0024825644|nr:hypothetical protein [Polyangium sp. 6x1]MDI1451523.1 hypothetical protein [Polyangium sp. 6x1]
MKPSQARKQPTPAPAPKKRLAKLITLFVRPRSGVREAPKKPAASQAPRPMPAPFVLPTPPPSAPPEPAPASDPILRSVVAALAPDPDMRAPEALRERLVAWAEETAEPATPAPAPLDTVAAEPPSLWDKLRRLAPVLLERFRKASRGAR